MSVSRVIKLIDIGANLTDPMFRGIYHSSQKHKDDFEHMLSRAREGGVEKIIVTGGTLEESKEALQIAKRDENLFSTVGCHPTRCNEFDNHEKGPDAYITALKDLALEGKNKIVAIGELGLDYDRLHFCSKETQKKYFELQLKLSIETKLPLFLHNRNSTDDLVDILKKNRDKLQAGGVVHSFDGTLENLHNILDLGLSIGINGCSLRTGENLEVVKAIPTDKLMIETDCPYCDIRRTHPSFQHVQTHFQKSKDASDPKLQVKSRNEPASLIQVLEVLSSVREEDIYELSEQIYKNTNKLFFNN